MTNVDLSKYGPWAVVAGGSEGVGAEFVRLLAEAGINVVIIARKPGPLAETAELARAAGVQVRTLALDLLAADATDQIIDATADLDVGLLIFNAGANTFRGEFVESTAEQVQPVIDLNITVQLVLCRHYGAAMKARGSGGILLVGSLAGYIGHASIGVYAAAKAFSRIFAEGLWLELKPFGVDVLELVLGLTRTPAMERVGLQFDLPGMNAAWPAEVAAEGFAYLADGPIRVVTGNEEAAATRSVPDRAAAVERNAGRSRQMLTGK